MQHQARKRFGQNFLHDPGVIRGILAAVAARPGQHLVEIGPGQGAITEGLLETAGVMDLIELDRDLIAPLADRFGGQVMHRSQHSSHSAVQVDRQKPSRLRIHNADALSFDLCALLPRSAQDLRSPAPAALSQPATDSERDPPAEHRLRLIGNLPYNISTPLLFRFLDQSDCIEDMHLMLQKEVVDRMTAEPGTKVYGRLSVMVQTFCSARRLFLVSAGAFRPAPKVSSAVVRLHPHRPLPYPLADSTWHARIVAAAFAQRRKTLRNSLSGLITPQQMIALEIDPGARAETLSVAHFAALANASSACIDAQIP
ncbi:MAG: 16S rRNA (adenine(1518)-N(6)/adenine(1519)-N(6))-dimethyltransferase RsmA [Lamprobacter sp.]|uniref:16S rRNA (adenine(1518)-N(6)/adenine(1519)-N(6))- dimethyltransferase RsmA n=1 Tax=Lamprobacter sp. TaxID=3100796 RepID=UPI002B26203F|nr:16S rRNA (adenine(1518)-N(6)/adenine(1519)-N(6))-dimethyltransferase RsmA [Lamprobacter sp.]MEA3639464.1 16S rRNA (adenine(1518)-N(6)/adenine(1519)-N(6))-dimethyltransferase RsmA [Lamprobacter sp.]